jgi:hypothetical protein
LQRGLIWILDPFTLANLPANRGICGAGLMNSLTGADLAALAASLACCRISIAGGDLVGVGGVIGRCHRNAGRQR